MAIKYIIHGGSFFDSSKNIRCISKNPPHDQNPDKEFRMAKNDNFRSSGDSTDKITSFRLAKNDSDYCVLHGGAWNLDGVDVRGANRVRLDPSYGYHNVGFRLMKDDFNHRVLRGGAFNLNEDDVRCVSQDRNYPSREYSLIGVRLLISNI